MTLRQKQRQFTTGPIKTIAAMSVAALALAGCNTDSSGTMSLDITDAPVDSALEVNVVFDGVDIHSARGNLIEITYDEPRSINLLDYQGGATASLLDDEWLPAGDYQWISLRVDATKEAGGSNILLDDGSDYDLYVPSGDETGLKLVQGFTVPVNGSVAFTIDFDLRKSVVEEDGTGFYKLRPALRLVDNTQVGSIAGPVDSNTLTADCSGAVYVYEGENVTPGDVGGNGVEPIVTALVDTDDSGVTKFDYKVAFLTEGDYTAAFTCGAAQDDPEGADTLTFIDPQNASVVANQSVTINF
ncbi:DUF4382 domain-containing protein [Saccharospirillum sp.]|uniref:DUF4382 domain-containing protein n=1 Tax=Saccharospirillum sp. TaxID=2033801 RepID=UPI0034A06C07